MTILLPAKSRDTNFTRTGCIAIILALLALPLRAQIGEHRDDLAVGGGAGVTLSSVGFMPKVSQGLHVGPTFGVAARYVCEKYYTMVCSVLGEVNFASLGWKEDILDPHDDKVINSVTGKMFYRSRNIAILRSPDIFSCISDNPVYVTSVSSDICNRIVIIQIQIDNRGKCPVYSKSCPFRAGNLTQPVCIFRIVCRSYRHLFSVGSTVNSSTVSACFQVRWYEKGYSALFLCI